MQPNPVDATKSRGDGPSGVRTGVGAMVLIALLSSAVGWLTGAVPVASMVTWVSLMGFAVLAGPMLRAVDVLALGFLEGVLLFACEFEFMSLLRRGDLSNVAEATFYWRLLSVMGGVFGLVVASVYRWMVVRGGLPVGLALPLSFFVLERLIEVLSRSLVATTNGPCTLALRQADCVWLVQSAAIGGLPLVSWLTAAIAGVCVDGVWLLCPELASSRRTRRLAVLFNAGLIGTTLGYGALSSWGASGELIQKRVVALRSEVAITVDPSPREAGVKGERQEHVATGRSDDLRSAGGRADATGEVRLLIVPHRFSESEESQLRELLEREKPRPVCVVWPEEATTVRDTTSLSPEKLHPIRFISKELASPVIIGAATRVVTVSRETLLDGSESRVGTHPPPNPRPTTEAVLPESERWYNSSLFLDAIGDDALTANFDIYDKRFPAPFLEQYFPMNHVLLSLPRYRKQQLSSGSALSAVFEISVPRTLSPVSGGAGTETTRSLGETASGTSRNPSNSGTRPDAVGAGATEADAVEALSLIEEPLTPGPPPRMIGARGESSVERVRIGVGICHDICFPEWSGDWMRLSPSPDLLIQIASEGMDRTWHAQTLLLASARFRAIESRRPLVRCVRNGYSAVIDSCGRVRQVVTRETHDQPFVTVPIPLPVDERLSFYTRFGSWPSLGPLVAVSLAFLWFGNRGAATEKVRAG